MVDVTEAIHRRLEELESKADPDDLDLEVLARLYLAVGSEKALADLCAARSGIGRASADRRLRRADG